MRLYNENMYNKPQNDLDKLVKLSDKWQMPLNFGKCKCLYSRQVNLDVNFKIGDTILDTLMKIYHGITWYTMELHGIPWNYMVYHG